LLQVFADQMEKSNLRNNVPNYFCRGNEGVGSMAEGFDQQLSELAEIS
jgi:hypothetical protein